MDNIKKYIGAAVLGTAMMAVSGCTDTWNEHYDIVEGGMADQPTLLENIQGNSDLANFYKVIQAIKAEDFLNSPQQLTVWAPKNLTDKQVDSIITVYQNDESNGVKWEDNKAVAQFLYNHTALYSRPVSSMTDDTLSLLNKKYVHLKGTSASSGTANGHAFNDAVLSSNGILYISDDLLPFFPNVRQYVEQVGNMDNLAQLIADFDEYILDEDASVAGEVIDGKINYLDSVTYLTNIYLSAFGYIHREDSVYTLVAPTDALWEKEYEKYSKYFQYCSDVNHVDSLTDINAKLCIMQGRYFNTSENWKYNRHPEDSLVNTQYWERQSHNPRRNVYYNPTGSEGILNGLEKVECSNGFVYIDNQGVIDPHTTFFYRQDIPAYYSNYYKIPTQTTTAGSTKDLMKVNNRIYYIYDEEDETKVKKSYNYLYVEADGTTDQSQITYTLPSTMSGMYYNVYLVTIPDQTNNLPCWFKVDLLEKKEDGTFPNTPDRTKVKNETTWLNPHPVLDDPVVSSVASRYFSDSDKQYCFIGTPEKVDTVLLQSAVQFKYSGADLDEGVVKLVIGSLGPAQSSYREKIYTRHLRLNELILVPFETKEEAEAAMDDIDAFNDDLLEANKEN